MANDLSLGDGMAIRQLLHQYCHRLDNGTAAGVGALFHPEATLVLGFTPLRKTYVGRAALTGWFGEVHKTGRDRGAECLHPRHSIANPVVVPVDERRANVTVSIWAHDVRQGRATMYEGYYRDEVVKADGRWYFWCKRIHLLASYPVSGTTLWRETTACYL